MKSNAALKTDKNVQQSVTHWSSASNDEVHWKQEIAVKTRYTAKQQTGNYSWPYDMKRNASDS